MPAGEHEYLLNCCINDEPDRVFPVKVPKAASVGELRKAIWEKNKHKFDDIDASSLTLWKVSIADEELDSKVDEGLVGGTKLRDLAQLSQVFSDPPKPGHLHIIVQRPISKWPLAGSFSCIVSSRSPTHPSCLITSGPPCLSACHVSLLPSFWLASSPVATVHRK